MGFTHLLSSCTHLAYLIVVSRICFIWFCWWIIWPCTEKQQHIWFTLRHWFTVVIFEWSRCLSWGEHWPCGSLYPHCMSYFVDSRICVYMWQCNINVPYACLVCVYLVGWCCWSSCVIFWSHILPIYHLHDWALWSCGNVLDGMVRSLYYTITWGYVGTLKSHPDAPDLSEFCEHLSTKYCAIVVQWAVLFWTINSAIAGWCWYSPCIAMTSKWQIDWDCNLSVLSNASLQSELHPFQLCSNSYPCLACPSSNAWELDLWIDTCHSFWTLLELLL